MRKIFFGTLILCVCVITLRCTSELVCEPVVVSTNIDYVADPHALPYAEIHAEFAENYSGQDLSISLRTDIIQDMEDKAENLGEDTDILYECIKATYEDWNARPMRIPCYAEKCLYDNQQVWAIAFNRANSFDESKIEHFDIFYMSCSGYKVLFWDGCL